MIDTHCHLNSNAYSKDRDEVIKSAFADGLECIIVPTAEPKDFNKTIKLVQQYENIYCSIGVHPHNAKEVDNKVLEDIKKLATYDKVVAIGEIGLDYHHNHSLQFEQMYAFEQQIKIAQELSLPIIVHNRESDADMIKLLSRYYPTGQAQEDIREKSNDNNSNSKVFFQKEKIRIKNTQPGVFHCYSSDVRMLDKVLDMGFLISFTANITFPKMDMDEVVLNVPMDKLLLETDSPYMTPPPNRGQRNVPQAVKVVAEKISKVKNISIEEVIKMTNANAKKLFGLSLCLILFIFGSLLFGTNELNAQTNTNQDSYYDDWEYYDDFPDIYVRRLGFGPLFISNTFVDRYTEGAKSFSHEGIFAFGGLVNFRIIENLIIQGVYTYAKNNTFVSRLPDSTKGWIDPNYHKAVELSVIGMLNPRQMINFYGSAGTAYFINKLSRNYDGQKFYFDDKKLGMNAGVGIFINFSLGNAGTLVVNGEWKINFRLDEIALNYDPRHAPGTENYNRPSQYSQMSSMPRGGIIWYIPFLK